MCPSPCFLTDTGSFAALIELGPLSEDQLYSDTDALGCARWDFPEAACDVDSCIHNYFCFDKYEAHADS